MARRDVGYDVATDVARLESLGVPQRRRRHILLACSSDLPRARELLRQAVEKPVHRGMNDLWSTIGDLVGVKSSDKIDAASRTSPENARRIDWLFRHREYDLPNTERPDCQRNDHRYLSMYGRLRWDKPAQTITTGFGSMGQGRYVHPSEPRTITPHEAARIQTFPDFFRFDRAEGARSLATLIGNAVPPALMLRLGLAVLPYLIESANLRPAPVQLDPLAMAPIPKDCSQYRNTSVADRDTPNPSSEDAGRRMRIVRQRDTAPEIALRSILHRRGLRYRVDVSPIRGSRRRADILFPSARVAVYVDGCFWHGCPLHATWPKANPDWWRQKLVRNVERDRDTDIRLAHAGWTVLRVWSHEDSSEAAERVVSVVRGAHSFVHDARR